MKKLLIISLVFSLLLSSCAYDNFDEPTSVISGQIVHNGKTLGFRSNAMSLQLYQPGFGLYTAVNVAINQDGTFNAVMFDGDYKLINASGTTQPWVLRTDTLKFSLNGSVNLDYEVTPYFIINDETYTKSGTNITASCKLQQVATTATLQSATLYISRTAICNENYNEAKQQLNASAITDLNNVNFTVAIPQRLIDQGFCYVRVGVKASQASERLYTQMEKISF